MAAGQRMALTTLVANGHARACEVEASCLGIPHRTFMNWMRQSAEKGPGSFYAPRPVRGGTVLTPGKAAECGRLLDGGLTVSQAARQAGVKESTLRKAISSGRIVRAPEMRAAAPDSLEWTDKSARSAADARAADGMGTACTRAGERMAAALGLSGAAARFERCRDVAMGGLLAGLPALCGNGLLSGIGKHLSLADGYYSVLHILTFMGFLIRLFFHDTDKHHTPHFHAEYQGEVAVCSIKDGAVPTFLPTPLKFGGEERMTTKPNNKRLSICRSAHGKRVLD